MNTRNTNFYITRESDFSARIDIIGADCERVDLNWMNFFCDCYYERDESNRMMVICNVVDDGKLEMFVPKAVTRELPDGNWVFQLHMEYKRDGSEYIPLEGKFILKD